MNERIRQLNSELHSYGGVREIEKPLECTMADYLAFAANMIFHGRGYLFKGGESDAEREDKNSESRRRRTSESGQTDEKEPQQYRIVFDD